VINLAGKQDSYPIVIYNFLLQPGKTTGPGTQALVSQACSEAQGCVPQAGPRRTRVQQSHQRTHHRPGPRQGAAAAHEDVHEQQLWQEKFQPHGYEGNFNTSARPE
jgi:hypothetical protein